MEVTERRKPFLESKEEVVYKPLREVDFKKVARFLGWDESQVRQYQHRETSREGAVDKDHVELRSPQGLYVNIGLDDQEIFVSSKEEKSSFHLGHLKVDKVALRIETRRVETTRGGPNFKQVEFSGEDELTIDHDSLVRANVNGRQTVWAP